MFLRKRFLFVIVIVLLFALAILGCPQPDDDPDDPLADAIEVVLGYTGPLSGPAAEYGQDGLNGLLMAVDDINAAGGITIGDQLYTFAVKFYDDGADPTQSMLNVERLLDRDGAVAIYNMVYTSTQPMLEVNRDPGNEFIMMAYTSVPVEYDHANELALWLPPPFITYTAAMTGMARAQGWDVCVAVVDTGAYGQLWMSTFKAYWEGAGGTFAGAESGNYYAEQDYSTQITAALDKNPDFLLIGGPSGGTMLVVEQARDAGFEGGFVILDQAKMDWIAHHLGGLELLENAIGVIPPFITLYEAMDVFDIRYTEKYVDEGKATVTTWEAAIHYSATHALVYAMEAAGTVDDVHAIIAAVPDVLPMMGADYPYEFHGISTGGRFMGMGSITIVKDGDYEEPGSIIWWPRTQEEFDAAAAAATVSPDIPPVWIPFPPLQ